MSNKERLEEIEERVLVDKVYYKYLDGTKGHWGKVYTLSEEDYNYLKEQAERVQELERKIERYRKALEEIRDIGICGRIISTGEIIRSKEANLAEEALEEK